MGERRGGRGGNCLLYSTSAFGQNRGFCAHVAALAATDAAVQGGYVTFKCVSARRVVQSQSHTATQPNSITQNVYARTRRAHARTHVDFVRRPRVSCSRAQTQINPPSASAPSARAFARPETSRYNSDLSGYVKFARL